MSLPEHIQSESLSFFDPSLLITNIDWLYLLQVNQKGGLAEKSCCAQVEFQGLDAFIEQVDYARPTYIKLRHEFVQQLSLCSQQLTENLLNCKEDYFARASQMFRNVLRSRTEKPILPIQYHKCTYQVYMQCKGQSNSSALQSNPSRWPWGLDDFYKSLLKQDQLSLFYEPDYQRQLIDNNLQRLIKTQDHTYIAKILIEYYMRVGIFKQVLSLCELNVKERIPLPKIKNKTTSLHYMRSSCDQGGFNIMQLQYFTKLNYHQVTITSSLQYLYVLICSPVGGMYKIGTGLSGTIAGKVYLNVPIKKQEDVQWVYMQNKLYLRQQNGTLDIICPETFQILGQITLHCPDLFQHPQLQAINKNYPLLTDGEKLYIIGRKLNITKTEGAPTKLKDTRKKKEAEPPQDHTLKIMDFLLYEFDLNKPTGNILNEEDSDKKLLQELYDSFQGFFSRGVISKALNFNKNDVQNAAQWLAEEGEKERNKTIVAVSQQTLLCQAEITTDISGKQIKSCADIGCKDGSILTPSMVSNIVWTMNDKQISAYTEQGIKIFSKDPSFEKELDQHKGEFNIKDHYSQITQQQQKQKLRGSLITIVDKYKSIHYQTPNYIITYEPNSNRFYVMHIQWNSSSLQFPALITIGSEFKQTIYELQSNQKLQFDDDITNFLLQQQEQKYFQEWRLNDWHYAYLLVLQGLSNDNFSDEEQKKIASEKSKFIQRMNKGLPFKSKESIQEIKKVYAFCIEGTFDELKLIWNLYKKYQKQSYLNLLILWFDNSSTLITLNKDACILLNEIGEYLYQNGYQSIFIKGWPLFMNTNILQMKYLQTANQELLQQIINTYSSIQAETESALYKTQIKIPSDYSTNLKTGLRQQQLIEPLSKLLTDSIKCKKLYRQTYPQMSQSCTQQFWILAKEWAQDNSLIKWKFLEFIFAQTLNKNMDNLEEEHNLIQKILEIFEIGISQKETKEIILKNNILNQFLLQIYLSPIIEQPKNVSILQSLMTINKNIESNLTPQRTQGVDPIGFKIFETNHPYERQKTQSFEDTFFPGALALLVEFDSKCSSDQAHDFLTINSWYSPHNGPLGLQAKAKDRLAVSYRVSGKVSPNTSIVMLGNVIQADFSPSGQARNEHSLNRWGFKIIIRPIYGDTNGEILQQLILKQINSLLGLSEKRTQIEEQNQHLLKWNLLKNGKVGFQLDKYLIKVLGQLSIAPIPQSDYQYQQDEIQTFDIEQLKQSNQFIKQILNKQGEFYKFVEELLSRFPDSMQYRTAKQRKAMKPHLEDFKQVECLLILAILYHSGLIGETDFRHVEHHQEMLKEAYNEVINYMLGEVDVINEFQQNYEGMLLQATEMMEQQKLKQLSSEIEKTLWEMLHQRLEGNSEMIFKICKYLKISVFEDNPNQSLKQIFNLILSKCKEQKLDLVNPYQIVAEKVKHRLLLLFNVSNTPLIGQHVQQYQRSQSMDSGSVKLRPLGLERSVSHQIDDKNIDSQKLLKFRQWLNSYQKWKQLHKIDQISVESLDIPPAKSVILFVKENVIPDSLLQVMDLHNRRCVRRIAAFKFLNEYNPNGTIHQDILTCNIELASSNAKEVLLQEVVKRLNYLMQSIKGDYAQYLSQAIQQQMDVAVLEQMKTMCMTLCEINSLFQVDNNILWKSSEKDYNPHFNPLFKNFLSNVIQTALLTLAFVNLDQQYQSVASLSKSILQNIKRTLFIVTDNLMSNEVLECLSNTLLLELGINEKEKEINARLLVKIHDLIGVRRLNFLLTHILDQFLSHQNQEITFNLALPIFYILYHTNTPSTMRLAIRIVKFINVNNVDLINQYAWLQYNKDGQITKEIIQSEQLNYQDSLIKRVGQLISNEHDNSIQSQLLNRLSQIQNNKVDTSQYKVILHLCQEEEISILLKIAYWWEEVNQKMKLPQTYQEYLELKEKEKKREEQRTQLQEVITQQEFQFQRLQQQQSYKILERVLLTYPDIQLPYLLGWGFNYSNIFGDMKNSPSDNKKHTGGRVKKQIKKCWKPLNYQELERLYDELHKQQDDIKSFPDEAAFLKQRNFITRIHNHIKEIRNYCSLLSVYGFVAFSEVFSLQKAQILIEIIKSALNGTLPPIPMDGLSEEFRNKADPNKYILIGTINEVQPPKTKSTGQKTQIQPQPTSGKSNMTVGLCDLSSFQSFEFRMDYITLLPNSASANFYNEINRSSSFTAQALNGQIVGQLIYELSTFLRTYPIDLSNKDQMYILGATSVLAQKINRIGPGMPVTLKRHKEKSFIIWGGDSSGLKEVALIQSNDDQSNIQVVKLEEVELYEEQSEMQQLDQNKLLSLIEQNKSELIQRNLYIISQNVKWSSENANKLIKLLGSMSESSNNNFIVSWERLIDSKQPLQYTFKQEVDQTLTFLQEQQQEQSEEVKIDIFVDSADNTNIVSSAYLSSLPESLIVSNELKLVRYWEKNILPKIYDYVKGSLRDYEIKDFFEQIRQQLRKGDQGKALEIAYIVCDQRMPNGAVIPESNHDWSTLTIEEVQSGQYVLCRLLDKTDQLYSKEFNQYKKQGMQFIIGQIMGVDQRSSSILVLHMDINTSQQYATWFPVSALKLVQLYIPPHAHSFRQETIQNQFNEQLQLDVKNQACNLYKLVSQSIDVDIIQYLQLTLTFEGSCINGWISDYVIDNNTRINEKLRKLTNLEWLSKSFQDVNSFVNNHLLTLDLAKTLKKPTELNSTLDIAGLAVVFKNDATLCTCSGINFYKDKMGINDFHTIGSGKETRGRLTPIILNQKVVYCEYYFNGEALPIYMQESCVSRLPCLIYKIPSLWNMCCYVVDQLGSLWTQDKNIVGLRQINNLIQKAMLNQPHILAQGLIKLLMRNLRKIQSISNESLDQDFLKSLLQEVNKLYSIQKVEQNVLYSSYLQDLTELLAVAYQKVQPPPQIPEWLHAFIQLISIAEFIKEGQELRQEIKDNITQMLNTEMWDRILILENAPCDLIEVLRLQQVRILDPINDIINIGNQQLIIFDGFSTLDIDNSEQQEVEEPTEEPVRFWQCDVCTCAENAWDSTQCVVCESPAPASKIPYKPQQEQDHADEQIPIPDLNEEDEKADKREKQRFEQLLEALNNQVKIYYDLLQQENNRKIEQLQGQLLQLQNQQKQIKKQYEKKLKRIPNQQLSEYTSKINECQDKIQAIQLSITVLSEQKFENNFIIYHGKQIFENQRVKFLSECLQQRIKNYKVLEQYNNNNILTNLQQQTKYDLWGNDLTEKQLLPLNLMQQLLRFLEMDICKETKAIKTYKANLIKLNLDENSLNYDEYKTSRLKYLDLFNSPLSHVRFSWTIIRLFNKYLDLCGQFINMDVPIGTTVQFQKNTILLSMGNYMQVLRRLCMTPTKVEIIQRVLNKTSVSRNSPPKVILERIRLANQASNQATLFNMAYEQMKNIPPTLLRPIKPQGTDPFLAFEVSFKGEDVQGESGPYRQFFADISKELQQSSLLLYPSTNQQAKIGNHKDKFVLNPGSRSNYHLHLYEFLGTLMGISIRTATHLSLDLPLLFWKHIVGEKIQIDDIEQVDATMCNLINFMQECSQQTFEDYIFENWVTLRTDGSLIELREGGLNQPVTYNERTEYINKLINVKYTESEIQCNNLIKGLIRIIPSPLLNWISAEDLELFICGRPYVDVELLKRHTRYSGDLNERCNRIQYFWETMLELTEQERLRFIKFCWGQERLPANDEEFERNQIRFMIKPATHGTKQPDKALPKADTCFFNLELPAYTSKEILKKNLLIAINFDCDSMNADARINLDPNARNRRNRDDDDDVGF